MPKVPVDYSQTCIYKLVHFDDLNDNNIYVGHTTNMTKRKWEHKNACCNPDNKHYNFKVYQFIRENGGWEQWRIILVEKYPCNDVYEAISRERYWVKELKATLNKREPGRTIKEWCEDNKVQIAEKKGQKIRCECGSIIRKGEISRHRKTIKHQEWLKNNNLSTN